MSQINARVRHKRDTSSNWTTRNPVLLDGELIIVDTDSGETRFKIGDGVKTYTQLPFQDEIVRGMIPTTASDVDAYSKTEIDNMELITLADIDAICGAPISFMIDGTALNAKAGMTWAEWVESDYNTINVEYDAYYHLYEVSYGTIVYENGSTLVAPQDSINANYNYRVTSGSVDI